MVRQRRIGGEKVDESAHEGSISPPASSGRLSRCFWQLVNILKWLAIVVVVPPLVNYASLKNEESALLPTDALHYDVGFGQKLMLRCVGKGAPTVILEHPAGMSSDVWEVARRQLSSITKVCMYDRAGIGFSDRPMPADGYVTDQGEKSAQRSQEFTIERMADDLRRLVTEASSQPLPFILVGLELGANAARFYSHMYDSQVFHVILIDPLSLELFSDTTFIKHWKEEKLRNLQSQQMSGAFGINRLALVTGTSQLPSFWSSFGDDNVTARQMHLSCHPKHLKSAVDELSGVLHSLHQIKTLTSVKPFPPTLNYTILYRQSYDSEETTLNTAWTSAQESLISSLQIPPEQVSIIPTKSRSQSDSLTGSTLVKLRSLVKVHVDSYRKGRPIK